MAPLRSLAARQVRQSVSEPDGDDFPADTNTPGRVEVGGSVTGNITNRDTDTFAADLEAGKTYRIDLEGADTGRGTLTDPVLEVKELDSGDITSASDDNSGEGKNARATFTPDDTKTYYLVVSGYRDPVTGQTATGTYRLRLREVALVDGRANRPIEGRLEPGDSMSGSFDDRYSWYYFTLRG